MSLIEQAYLGVVLTAVATFMATVMFVAIEDALRRRRSN